MNISEHQEAEIKTIKERDFKLKLSDADVERLFLKAGGAGLTVSELLENFIGDLVDGTYINGSDERDYAEQWFDRCWFGDPARNWDGAKITFLQWLIANDNVDEVVDAWDVVQDYSDQDVLDDDETNDLACARSEVSDIFNEYMRDTQAIKDSILDEEISKVMQWWDDLRKMKAGNDGEIRTKN